MLSNKWSKGGSIPIWTWLLPKYYVQIFLNASRSYRQDFNGGDFVQFTRRLVYENETLYITLINSPADNALPLSTPAITIAMPPKSCLRFGSSKLLIMNIMLYQQQASGTNGEYFGKRRRHEIGKCHKQTN